MQHSGPAPQTGKLYRSAHSANLTTWKLLLGVGAIVRKLVLSRTLRLHRLKPSYEGLDLLRRQAVNVEVQAHCQPHQRRAMRAAPVLCASRSCADAAPAEARRSVRRPGPT